MFHSLSLIAISNERKPKLSIAVLPTVKPNVLTVEPKMSNAKAAASAWYAGRWRARHIFALQMNEKDKTIWHFVMVDVSVRFAFIYSLQFLLTIAFRQRAVAILNFKRIAKHNTFVYISFKNTSINFKVEELNATEFTQINMNSFLGHFLLNKWWKNVRPKGVLDSKRENREKGIFFLVFSFLFVIETKESSQFSFSSSSSSSLLSQNRLSKEFERRQIECMCITCTCVRTKYCANEVAIEREKRRKERTEIELCALFLLLDTSQTKN